MSTDYGSGIELDRNFDFTVDPTGDIGAVFEEEEVHKDIAFRVYRALKYGEGIERPENIADDGIVGEPLFDGVLSDIEVAVAKVINEDPRIDFVESVEAEEADDREDFINLEVQALIEDSTIIFEQVIPAN